MYEKIRAIAQEAKQAGLAVVIWAYARGTSLSKEGETAIDVIGYAAHIAAQLGANIVKVKLPSAHLELAAAKKVYEARKVEIATPAERVAHVVQCAFAGRRIVIFSGGEAVDDTKSSMRRAPFRPEVASARSSAVTRFNARRWTQSRFCTRSWTSTLGRR